MGIKGCVVSREPPRSLGARVQLITMSTLRLGVTLIRLTCFGMLLKSGNIVVTALSEIFKRRVVFIEVSRPLRPNRFIKGESKGIAFIGAPSALAMLPVRQARLFAHRLVLGPRASQAYIRLAGSRVISCLLQGALVPITV